MNQMYRNRGSDKSFHSAPRRRNSDATRRVSRLAAAALEAAGRWDGDLDAFDVARLLGHPIAAHEHHAAAKAINDVCSGRRYGSSIPPTSNISLAVDILHRDAIETRVRRVTGEAARASHIPNDAARRARVLRLAADAIDADPHGRPINARDISCLLVGLIDAHDAYDAAETIRGLWAPGRMGRDAETDWLRGTAEFLLAESGGRA